MSDPDEPVGRRSETDVGAVAAATSGIPRAYQPIVQRYSLSTLLGRGGMGSVYRARERANGRDVALKQLRYPERLHDRAAFEAMFEREFRTLAELQHPRVIRVYDYGLDPSGPYYTMDRRLVRQHAARARALRRRARVRRALPAADGGA